MKTVRCVCCGTSLNERGEEDYLCLTCEVCESDETVAQALEDWERQELDWANLLAVMEASKEATCLR